MTGLLPRTEFPQRVRIGGAVVLPAFEGECADG